MVFRKEMARKKVQHTITLFLGDRVYLARHSDPSVKRLLGTDTLPTAFTCEADPHTVLTEIQRLNPGRLVDLADPLTQPPTSTDSPLQRAPFHSEPFDCAQGRLRERPTVSAANVPQGTQCPNHSERSERPNP